MKLSNRILKMEHSPIRRFYMYADQAEKEGKKIYQLNIGQPDIKTPKVFWDAVKNFDTEVLAYAPSQGIPELIDAICKYYARYGMQYDKDHVLITSGGSEALLFTLMSILDPDDEVIIIEPYYSNYSAFIGAAGGKTVPVTAAAEDGYHYAKKELIEKAITPRTKAMIITNPGNPTGSVLEKEEMRMILDLAIKHDFFIVSDEVYREFVYDGNAMASMGEFEYAAQNVVIIDSISKRFSACGARIGCAITKNEELYSNLLKLCQGRLCAPTLDQVGAVALYDLDPSYFDEIRDEYQHRRDVVYNELCKIEGIVCEKPPGAFYITAKLPVENAEDFLVWLLTEFEDGGETVMFAPAEGFYATPELGKNEMRIAYVLNEKDLIRAAELIRLGMERYQGK